MSLGLAAALRPFVALLLIAWVAAPIKRCAERNLPAGLLRRVLLFSWRV